MMWAEASGRHCLKIEFRGVASISLIRTRHGTGITTRYVLTALRQGSARYLLQTFLKYYDMKNGSKKISMKDIARELNISVTTVSFVVNGKSEQKNISAATVKKVQNLIEKRGFKPNGVARMLRTGK